MNAFESGSRKVIPAVLVYLRQGGRVLMIHRNAPGAAGVDYHQGKWNGLGGKCEADESPLEAALREVKEESGIDLSAEEFKPLGVLQFPNFKAHKNEDWIVFVFVASVRSDFSLENYSCKEGTLHWIPDEDIMKLNLWEGDRYFLPYVLDAQSFIGTFWYSGQKVERYWISRTS